MLVPDYGNETAHDSSSDREEASVTELLQGKHRLGWEMSQEQNDKSPVHTQRTPRTGFLIFKEFFFLNMINFFNRLSLYNHCNHWKPLGR